MTWTVGQRVVVRDAFGALLHGELAPVPREWRQVGCGDAYTAMGRFPKVYVQFGVGGPAVPWPVDDVFTDDAEAERAVAEAAS